MAENMSSDSPTGTIGSTNLHSRESIKVSSLHGVTAVTTTTAQVMCVVCGDHATGCYFTAQVCEACKSFFIRSTKKGLPKFHCQLSGNCDVTPSTRLLCQHCRFQKCLSAGMCRKVKQCMGEASDKMLCKVCNDVASGIHFGIFTCEGCKGFFRRSLKDGASYVCVQDKGCPVTATSRNICRYCRFQKCLRVGMSKEGIKLGRHQKVDIDIPASSSRMIDLSSGCGPHDAKSQREAAGHEEIHSFRGQSVSPPRNISSPSISSEMQGTFGNQITFDSGPTLGGVFLVSGGTPPTETIQRPHYHYSPYGSSHHYVTTHHIAVNTLQVTAGESQPSTWSDKESEVRADGSDWKMARDSPEGAPLLCPAGGLDNAAAAAAAALSGQEVGSNVSVSKTKDFEVGSSRSSSTTNSSGVPGTTISQSSQVLNRCIKRSFNDEDDDGGDDDSKLKRSSFEASPVEEPPSQAASSPTDMFKVYDEKLMQRLQIGCQFGDILSQESEVILGRTSQPVQKFERALIITELSQANEELTLLFQTLAKSRPQIDATEELRTKMDRATESSMQLFQERVTLKIIGSVKFAKNIPDFHNLSLADQMNLIKMGTFPCILSHVCWGGEDEFSWFRNTFFTVSSLLELVKGMMSSVYQFQEEFSKVNFDMQEFGLFTALIFINPDSPGLENTSVILKLHNKFRQIWKHYSLEKYGGLKQYYHCLSFLPKLYKIELLHKQSIKEGYKSAVSSNVNLPALFAEINL